VYFWNNGAEQPAIGALTAGRYAVKVSDANDCMVDRETILTEPPSLAFEAVFIHPGCDGPNTGSISVLNARGGVGPYRYTLSGGDFQESTIFPGLGDGSYTVRLKDANGCLADTTSRLIAAAIPRVILAAGYQLRLGYALKLEAFVNLVPKTVKWAPEDGLSCTNCLVPEASPVKNMVYTLSVTSADGCTTADSVAVTLVKYRPFFAPNVFSPNGDGTNDAFTIFGGPALRRMRALRVYSRWGELIFERLDFPANDPSLGWDGRYRGAPLQEGLFVWSAELEYVDGVVEVAKGEVSIIK
jgi:gliding motility-associated-like protein